jgi:hypothetical protein
MIIGPFIVWLQYILRTKETRASRGNIYIVWKESWKPGTDKYETVDVVAGSVAMVY